MPPSSIFLVKFIVQEIVSQKKNTNAQHYSVHIIYIRSIFMVNLTPIKINLAISHTIETNPVKSMASE